MQKGKDRLLTTGDVLTKTFLNPLEQLLGIDVMKVIEDSEFMKGILNFVLSIFGFPGGFEGWKRRRFLQPIEEDFGDKTESKARKEQISTLYETYQDLISHKSTEELKPENTVFEIYKKKGVRFLQNSEQFFKIDQPTLHTTLKDKLDTATLNPLAVKAVLGGTYVKTVDKKLVVNTDKINQNKEVFIDGYLKAITQHLAGNQKYLSKVDSTDTVVFTMISALFVQEQHVINGIEASVFLPTDFVSTTDNATIETPSATTTETAATTNPEQLKGYDGTLMYFDQIPGTDIEKQAFKTKVEEVSTYLGINPNRLMEVMKLESGFNHKAVNKVSNATGLIQFMPKTAKGLGTTVEALKEMTAVQQLAYVQKYYERGKGQFKSFAELRLFTFFPAALAHTGNPEYVFEAPGLSAQAIAAQNPGIDMDKDGKITTKDYHAHIDSTLEGIPSDFQGQFT
ncbi:MAG: transglycosylase SLT domain-containing protein [Candidatus Peribacteria bacterium]|nr:transglycosylase SLT domain-containing protein [Candidatus Peribacteria bacterium]